MSENIHYKCPSCDAPIVFDSASGKMNCPYCDTQIDIEAMLHLDEVLKQDNEENLSWENNDDEYIENDDGFLVYHCKFCGGEIIADDTLASTSCPFCENNIIIQSKFAGSLKPKYVIPFAFDKNVAKEKLKTHVSKRFVPKVFQEENHIDEIKGVYVPFWLFDSEVDANIIYQGEKINHYSDAHYNYTAVSVFQLNRHGSLAFSHLPVDGSTQMDNALLESLEPFPMEGLKDFQTAYLAGFLANKYDVDATECIEIANERIRHSTQEVFKQSTSQYVNVRPIHSNIQLKNNSYAYALYPIWLLHTKWNNKKFTFAMNGQTGKMVGNLPMNIKAVVLTFFMLILINSAIVYALASVVDSSGTSWISTSILLGFVFSFMIMMRWIAPLRTATGKSGAREYMKDLQFKQNQDIFLYRHVQRTKKENNPSASSGNAHRNASPTKGFSHTGKH